MKEKIFMYLFFFALLLLVFMYANSKNILEKYEEDISTVKEKVEKYKDSLEGLKEENFDLMYFNLEHNEDALSYFEKDGLDASTLIPFIKDKLYELNEVTGEHPLVPYASMTDGKIMINNIKFLNHKWIIADFSDGKYWGELFLTYQVDKDKNLTYKLVEHFLYPPVSY